MLQAFEFQSRITHGVIPVPDYLENYEMPNVKVIVLQEEEWAFVPKEELTGVAQNIINKHKPAFEALAK
jgi:hypothetical protein